MRRVFSIILAVAMIMTMITVPASAAVTVGTPLVNDTTGTTINNQTAKETVNGIAGKAADDASTFVSRTMPDSNTGNHKVQFASSPKTWGDLIVFGASFYKATNIDNVLLTGNGGVVISSPLKMSDSRVQDGWNRIVYVYDYSTTPTATGSPVGKWAAYLNGECIGEFGATRQNAGHNYVTTEGLTQLRLMFSCASSNPLSMYVDDCIMYNVTAPTDADKEEFLATLEVGKPAVDSSSKYTIDGNKLVIDGTATVADVTAGADTVRVYNDKGLLVSDATAVLKLGYKIVAIDSANEIYSYYAVLEKGVCAHGNDATSLSSAGFSFGNGKSNGAVTGVGEKADDDESWMISESSAGVKYMYFYHQFAEEIYLENGVRRENYLVADINVRNVDYASGGFMRFALSQNQTQLIPDTNFNKFNTNGWTHFRLVFSAPEGENYKYVDWADNIPDTTEDPDIIGKSIGHTVLYMNGTKIQEKDMTITESTSYTTGTNFNQTLDKLLFQFYDGNADNARSVYIDDMKIYTTDTDPGASSSAELADGSKYYVDSIAKKICYTEAITLNDIKASNPYLEFVAFDDAAYTTQIADSVTLKRGSVVTVKADNGLYTTYTVVDPSIIYEQTNAAGFTTKYNATYTDETADLAGKTNAAYVKADRTASNSGQTYIQVSYGKYMTIDTPEYVVLSLNVLPTAASVFNIGSHGGNGLLAGSINGNLVRNQWNKVIIVMENGSTEEVPNPAETIYTSCKEAMNNSPHKSYAYVNGSLVCSGVTQFGMHWNDGSDRPEQIFRILTEDKSANGASVTYIDDLVLREVNTIDVAALTAMPELPAIEGLSVVGSSITIDGDVAVSTLPEGVTVYTDATCTTKVTEGNLVNGYEVAYTDGKDVSYYTIELPADKIFADYSEYNSKWAKISNGTTEAATGIDGDENGAYLVYSTSREDKPTGKEDNPATPNDESIDAAQHNAFYGLGTYTAEFFGERPYSIFSVDFKLGADFEHMFFGSNQHQPISSAVTYSDPRLVDGWNNFVCVVDYETNKSITYVNGIPSTPINSVVGKDLKYNSIRLVVYDRGKEEGNANDATVPVATFDNIKVYASVTNPFAAPLTYEATAENVTFTACDYIKNGYDYVAIAAAFDANNNLVGNVAIGTDTVTIAKNAGATYYMGYIWNSTTGLIPVTAAVRAE